MIPNEQQEAAIMHGLERGAKWWEPRDLPLGRQELPSWLKGAHVDLMLQASNPPQVTLKISHDPWPTGEPKFFENEGEGAWTARSSDGWLMERHYHQGRVFEAVAWRLVGMDRNEYLKDGRLEWQIESNPASAEAETRKHMEFCQRDGTNGGISIEYKTILATEKQAGYGGRTFWIKLKDGREMALRGPWHGGPPVGWTEAYCWDMSREYNRTPDIVRIKCADGVVRRRSRPWHARGGSFGYFFSDDLVMKAVARYVPHMCAAMVYPGYGRARIEFYIDEWGAPKRFAEERRPGWGSPGDVNSRSTG